MVEYTEFKEIDRQILIDMVLDFYAGYEGGETMSTAKINRTIDHLIAKADCGTILMIQSSESVIGYCILNHYWSNEYGGIILFIDELYIIPSHRGLGIATAFIKHIQATRHQNHVGLCLEVSPYNPRAQELYIKLGFKPSKNMYMHLINKH